MSEFGSRRALATDRIEPTPAQRRLPKHSVSGVLVPLSLGIDLAEGRSPGHARRVAYLAMSAAGILGLDRDSQLAACYAGLAHDIGVIASGAGVAGATLSDERSVFASLPLLSPEEAVAGLGASSVHVADVVVSHVENGALAVRDIGLGEDVARAVATHHERWDGGGYPDGLFRAETPILGRILGVADHLEALLDQTSPLLARRNFSFWLSSLSGIEADPDVIAAFSTLSVRDSFWLGLYSAEIEAELAYRCSEIDEPRGARLLPMAEAFARLVDSRFDFTRNVSTRVAQHADKLGRAAGLTELRLKQLRLAALLHDVGQLSISERVLSKPGILSVEELGTLQLHTLYSRDVVAGIEGLEEVADWVLSHHERIDGRGYPEGRRKDEIPLEARILAVADAYVAITSDRPYRPGVEGEAARERLRAAAGSHLDAELVTLFLGKVIG